MKLRIAPFLTAALLVALPAAVPADTPASPTVHIKNFMFVPATLTVAPGTSVAFVNDDDEPHTVTSNDKSFDSEGLDTHQTFTHTFAKAGTFTYFNQIITQREGTISFATAAATAYPQPAPGTAPAPGPLTVPAPELLGRLGYRNVSFTAARATLSDRSLQGG